MSHENAVQISSNQFIQHSECRSNKSILEFKKEKQIKVPILKISNLHNNTNLLTQQSQELYHCKTEATDSDRPGSSKFKKIDLDKYVGLTLLDPQPQIKQVPRTPQNNDKNNDLNYIQKFLLPPQTKTPMRKQLGSLGTTPESRRKESSKRLLIKINSILNNSFSPRRLPEADQIPTVRGNQRENESPINQKDQIIGLSYTQLLQEAYRDENLGREQSVHTVNIKSEEKIQDPFESTKQTNTIFSFCQQDQEQSSFAKPKSIIQRVPLPSLSPVQMDSLGTQISELSSKFEDNFSQLSAYQNTKHQQQSRLLDQIDKLQKLKLIMRNEFGKSSSPPQQRENSPNYYKVINHKIYSRKDYQKYTNENIRRIVLAEQ